MCRVNSFLCCIKLETFGLIIGWTSFFAALIVAVPIIFVIVFGIAEFGRIIIGVCIIILILCCLLVYVCLELINGIETRDHEKVESFKNFCIFNVAAGAVFLCDCLYHALQSMEKFEPVVVHIVIGISAYWLVQIYILVCIHSLYRKFLEEKYPSLIKSCP